MDPDSPNTIYDCVIVGAGMTGLNLAFQLKKLSKNLKILVLEKSKSCGGRMATRRIGESKFDHGAQFIKDAGATEDMIHFWNEKKILMNFPSHAFEAYCALDGMTQLAKSMAEHLHIHYNFKLLKILKNDGGWLLTSEDGATIFSNHVILTCPVPQTLDLLRNSDLAFEAGLSRLTYAKAIVCLVQFATALNINLNYIENFDDDIFSLTSQAAKDLSRHHAYSICLSEKWSDSNFAKSDEELLELARNILKSKFEENNILSLDIKKWRYSHPKSLWKELYTRPHANLFLAGDAFGGPSLIGAMKSSNALFNHIKLSLASTGDDSL